MRSSGWRGISGWRRRAGMADHSRCRIAADYLSSHEKTNTHTKRRKPAQHCGGGIHARRKAHSAMERIVLRRGIPVRTHRWQLAIRRKKPKKCCSNREERRNKIHVPGHNSPFPSAPPSTIYDHHQIFQVPEKFTPLPQRPRRNCGGAPSSCRMPSTNEANSG